MGSTPREPCLDCLGSVPGCSVLPEAPWLLSFKYFHNAGLLLGLPGSQVTQMPAFIHISTGYIGNITGVVRRALVVAAPILD